MDISLRALSCAVRFFWMITAAFAATCIYSATLIGVNFGGPMMNSAEEDFSITLPIILDNKGYYNIADLNLTTVVVDLENEVISRTVTYVADVPPQDNITIYHNISLNLSRILDFTDYLFTDSNFTLCNLVNLNYAGLIPFRAKANTSMLWRAPLQNFTIQPPKYSAYNATHLKAHVPISFQNRSPYVNVTGTIKIEIFNESLQKIGEGTVSVDASSDTAYNEQVEALVNAAMVSHIGEVHVYVETEWFHFGPMVVNYG
ncbi:MAG: hypothetical protein ACLFU9_00190 [Candidatus Bathyarchaeia archaeon]